MSHEKASKKAQAQSYSNLEYEVGGARKPTDARLAYDYRLKCGLTLNLYSWTLGVDGSHSSPLSRRELQCVLWLDGAHECGVDPKELRREVFGSGQTNALNVHLVKLRRKLARLGYRVELNSKRFFLVRREAVSPPSSNGFGRPRVFRPRQADRPEHIKGGETPVSK